jgi:hypothetical protein
MDNKVELLEQFSKHFPDILFTIKQEAVERALLPHLKEFTREQWLVITNSKYNDLFAIGVPHISWRDERELIIWELINTYHLRPCATYSETWYTVKVYSVKMPNGTVLEMIVRDPRSWGSGSRTHYSLRVSDKFVPVPTHRAVILSIGEDTEAYITDQFAGSQEQCEDWVAKKISKGCFFKIMPI